MDRFLGWRKFLITTFGLSFAFILALRQELTADFVTVVSVTVVAFVGGNAVEHMKNGVKHG